MLLSRFLISPLFAATKRDINPSVARRTHFSVKREDEVEIPEPLTRLRDDQLQCGSRQESALTLTRETQENRRSRYLGEVLASTALPARNERKTRGNTSD